MAMYRRVNGSLGELTKAKTLYLFLEDKNSKLRRVVFLYANVPEPILLERMAALDGTKRYETHAVFWHRRDSTLTIPWSTDIDMARFIRVDLPDPRGWILRRVALTVLFALRVRKHLKYLDPDVVVAVYPDMLLASKIAMFGRRTLPIMYELWDVQGPERLGFLMRFLMKRLMRRLKSIFVTAKPYESQYLRANQLISESTRVIYASNSPANWTYRALSENDNDRDLVIGYIGQIRQAPQLQNLIHAMETLREAGIRIKLLIAGGGESKGWIEGLSKNVDFIDYRGPFDFQLEIEALYSEIDLMFAVYPQSQFNFRVHWARRAHQAILSGIPLIVASGSYMGDYIERHGLGWIAKDDSLHDLEKLLYEVAKDRSKLSSFRTDSESILSEHRFENFQNSVIEEYDFLYG